MHIVPVSCSSMEVVQDPNHLKGIQRYLGLHRLCTIPPNSCMPSRARSRWEGSKSMVFDLMEEYSLSLFSRQRPGMSRAATDLCGIMTVAIRRRSRCLCSLISFVFKVQHYSIKFLASANSRDLNGISFAPFYVPIVFNFFFYFSLPLTIR